MKRLLTAALVLTWWVSWEAVTVKGRSDSLVNAGLYHYEFRPGDHLKPSFSFHWVEFPNEKDARIFYRAFVDPEDLIRYNVALTSYPATQRGDLR